MRKRYLEIAKDRKKELIKIIKNSENKNIKNNAVKQLLKLELKNNLGRDTEEKGLYCKYCKKAYIRPKIRVRIIRKNNKEILQKRYFCDNCGKEQRQNLQKI